MHVNEFHWLQGTICLQGFCPCAGSCNIGSVVLCGAVHLMPNHGRPLSGLWHEKTVASLPYIGQGSNSGLMAIMAVNDGMLSAVSVPVAPTKFDHPKSHDQSDAIILAIQMRTPSTSNISLERWASHLQGCYSKVRP